MTTTPIDQALLGFGQALVSAHTTAVMKRGAYLIRSRVEGEPEAPDVFGDDGLRAFLTEWLRTSPEAQRVRELFLQRAYPYPTDRDNGTTHWVDCWRSPRHHNCAVAEIDRLEALRGEQRAAAPQVSEVEVIARTMWIGLTERAGEWGELDESVQAVWRETAYDVAALSQAAPQVSEGVEDVLRQLPFIVIAGLSEEQADKARAFIRAALSRSGAQSRKEADHAAE